MILYIFTLSSFPLLGKMTRNVAFLCVCYQCTSKLNFSEKGSTVKTLNNAWSYAVINYTNRAYLTITDINGFFNLQFVISSPYIMYRKMRYCTSPHISNVKMCVCVTEWVSEQKYVLPSPPIDRKSVQFQTWWLGVWPCELVLAWFMKSKVRGKKKPRHCFIAIFCFSTCRKKPQHDM